MKTLPHPIDAVLIDMDGTLFDTELAYTEAMRETAHLMGREMTVEFCHSTAGIPGPARNEMIRALYGEDFSIDDYRERFTTIVRARFSGGAPLKPGAVALLDFLKARGLKTALATSARRLPTETRLQKAGLFDHFAAIATRDDVAEAKPAPDIYLEAARRLGVAPERCVAFEDSNIGLLAAHAAGTMAFLIPDLVQPPPEIRALCAGVLPDLHAAVAMLRTALAKTSPPRA
jgi:HAD superfamily hydrolase (TIGR01509 family)